MVDYISLTESDKKLALIDFDVGTTKYEGLDIFCIELKQIANSKLINSMLLPSQQGRQDIKLSTCLNFQKKQGTSKIILQ